MQFSKYSDSKSHNFLKITGLTAIYFIFNNKQTQFWENIHQEVFTFHFIHGCCRVISRFPRELKVLPWFRASSGRRLVSCSCSCSGVTKTLNILLNWSFTFWAFHMYPNPFNTFIWLIFSVKCWLLHLFNFSHLNQKAFRFIFMIHRWEKKVPKCPHMQSYQWSHNLCRNHLNFFKLDNNTSS